MAEAVIHITQSDKSTWIIKVVIQQILFMNTLL